MSGELSNLSSGSLSRSLKISFSSLSEISGFNSRGNLGKRLNLSPAISADICSTVNGSEPVVILYRMAPNE